MPRGVAAEIVARFPTGTLGYGCADAACLVGVVESWVVAQRAACADACVVEVAVVGSIIVCANWQRYADEARKRQEKARAEADEGHTVEPLVVTPAPVQQQVLPSEPQDGCEEEGHRGQ